MNQPPEVEQKVDHHEIKQNENRGVTHLIHADGHRHGLVVESPSEVEEETDKAQQHHSQHHPFIYRREWQNGPSAPQRISQSRQGDKEKQ